MAPSHQPQLTLQHRPSVLAGCLTTSRWWPFLWRRPLVSSWLPVLSPEPMTVMMKVLLALLTRRR